MVQWSNTLTSKLLGALHSGFLVLVSASKYWFTPHFIMLLGGVVISLAGEQILRGTSKDLAGVLFRFRLVVD